jgi:hypothetical protein
MLMQSPSTRCYRATKIKVARSRGCSFMFQPFGKVLLIFECRTEPCAAHEICIQSVRFPHQTRGSKIIQAKVQGSRTVA